MGMFGTFAQKEQMEREKALYRYAEAFEQGDMDAISNVLQEAEQDVVLGQMIMELHEGYQQEEDGAEKVVYEREEIYSLSPSAIVETGQYGNRTPRPAKGLRRVSTFLQMVAAVLVCALLVGGFLALFASRHGGVGSPQSSWCIAANPQLPGYSMYLSGITVVSVNDVWAVGTIGANSGQQQFITTPLIEHWNGQTWSIMQTLRPPLGELRAVSAVSATDVWAVGSANVGIILGKNDYRATLVEHWDGTQWSVVPSPNLYTGGSAKQGDTNTLMAVSALSSNNVWMVGSSTSATKKSTLEPGGTWTEKLIEHWDGKQVAIVPSPNPALTGTMLKGVAVIAADNVWTVGWDGDRMGKPAIVEHWDGKQWSVVPVVEGYLSAISAVSAQDVWAVGGLAVPGVPSTAVVEHWDGTHWQNVPSASPNKGGTYSFESVAAVSANNVWAVGRYYTHNGVESPLIEHWDGKTWNIVSSPNPSNSTFGNYSLVSVSATGEHVLWSVGNGISNTGSDNTGLVEKTC